MMGQRVFLTWKLCLAVLLLSVLPEISAVTLPNATTTISEPGPFSSLIRPILILLEETFGELQRSNISTECKRDVTTVMKAAMNQERWALRMLDSVGKPSSGIMDGGLSFPGYYHECVSARWGKRNKGKYCLVQFNFNHSNDGTTESQEIIPSFYTNVRIGVCVPASCSNNEVSQAITSAAVSVSSGTSSAIQNCYEDDKNLLSDAGALAVLFILLLFVVLALVGTMLEWWTGRVSSCSQILPPAPDPCPESKSHTSSSNPSISFSNNTSSEALYRSKSPPGVTVGRILRCFSLIENSKKLLSTSSGDGSLDALHGIRFLSMAWIMTGHSFSFAQQWLFFRNPGSMASAPRNILSQAIANGTFSVDTFFFLSGFLVAYVLLRELKRNDGRFSVPFFYLHRYIRLAPLMMMVIGICATVLRYMGSGPMWKEATLMYDTWCKQNWWLNALFLQNFFHRQEMCLSHTWYSAVDMQMYIVSPIIIYLCYRHVYLAVAALVVPFIITSALPIALTMVKHLPALPSDNAPEDLLNEYFAAIYVKPYCRMGPYLVGISLAYFLYKNNETLVPGKRLRVIGWMLAASVNVGVIFSMGRVFNNDPPSDIEAAMYNGFARTAWAMTVAWIAYSCTAGYASTLNKLLSLRALQPLSRLTYSSYLIHPVLMALFYGTRETVFDYSGYLLIYLVLGNLFITYTVSLALSLLFESPIIAIERILRGRH